MNAMRARVLAAGVRRAPCTTDSREAPISPPPANRPRLTPPPRPPQVRFVQRTVRPYSGCQLKARVPFVPALVALTVVALPTALWWGGRNISPPQGAPVQAHTREQNPSSTAAQLESLGSALANLREGETAEALAKLEALGRDNPALASLDYALALAHLQSGNFAACQLAAERSIGKGERTSDCLALLSAVENVRAAEGGMSASRERSFVHLRDAMAADPANPRPYVEMAMRLRAGGKSGEAQSMIKAARARLDPVALDSLLDSTEILMSLESSDDSKLPPSLDPDAGAAPLFGAAYVALRRGDENSAAALLERGRRRLPPELFSFIMRDPCWNRFVGCQTLGPFLH